MFFEEINLIVNLLEAKALVRDSGSLAFPMEPASLGNADSLKLSGGAIAKLHIGTKGVSLKPRIILKLLENLGVPKGKSTGNVLNPVWF